MEEIKSDIFFSVIIPSYNYSNVILRAINSVQDQINNEFSIELIIVDDCSTDNSASILEQYISTTNYKNINITHNKTNKGPAYCRNLGVSKSNGKYILFLDADDELAKNSLDTIYEFIISGDNQDSNIDVVIANHNNISLDKNNNLDSQKLVTNYKLSNNTTNNLRNYLFYKKISITAGSIIFNKAIFKRIKFNENLRQNEDLLVFTYCLANYKCLYLDFCTVNIYKHSASLRHQYTLLDEQRNVLDLVDSIFSPNNMPVEYLYLRKYYLSQRYLSLFRSSYLARQYKQAKYFYHKAISYKLTNLFKFNYLKKYLLTIVKDISFQLASLWSRSSS